MEGRFGTSPRISLCVTVVVLFHDYGLGAVGAGIFRMACEGVFAVAQMPHQTFLGAFCFLDAGLSVGATACPGPDLFMSSLRGSTWFSWRHLGVLLRVRGLDLGERFAVAPDERPGAVLVGDWGWAGPGLAYYRPGFPRICIDHLQEFVLGVLGLSGRC